MAPLGAWAAGSGALGGTFSNFGMGTRPQGMGGAFVAVADDANAAFDCPAGMAMFPKEARYATFTHANLFSLASLTRDFIAFAQADARGFGAMGLSWSRFAATLEPETWTEDSFAYSGAKSLSKGEGSRLALGWNVKYMRVDSGFAESTDYSSVGGGTASGYGLGLSLFFKPRPSLSVAAAVNDLYSSLNWTTGTLEILSPSGRAGFSYRLTESTLFAAEGRGQQSTAGFGLSSWHAGAEHWLFDGKELMWDSIRNIGIRGGYFQQVMNGDAGSASVGATAKADEWQLDYAYQVPLSSSSLGATHRFGLGVNF